MTDRGLQPGRASGYMPLLTTPPHSACGASACSRRQPGQVNAANAWLTGRKWRAVTILGLLYDFKRLSLLQELLACCQTLPWPLAYIPYQQH